MGQRNVLMWGAALSLVTAIGVHAAGGQTTARAVAARMKNPVAANAASVSAGEALYQKQCRLCHGATGLADTAAAKSMGASNLADATWTRGGSDGEIFVVIQEGAGPEFKMKGFKGKLSDQDTWHVVNYVKSLSSAQK
ncbi:MAG: cytochrome c [Vicinamibacterales bacterium]